MTTSNASWNINAETVSGVVQRHFGYLNKRKEDGRSDIVIDPIRGPIIQRIFQEYVAGAYSITEMTQKAKQWGLEARKEII